MPVAGKGPSESQRFGKDITDQCRRSRKYAESILNDSDEKCHKRAREWRKSNDRKKKKSNDENNEATKRKERFRTSRSRKFIKTFQLARENHRHVKLLSVNQINGHSQQCSLKYFNQLIQVEIQEKPSCSCSYYQRSNVRNLDTCLHIVWVLLNYYRIADEDPLLHQVALTRIELMNMFDKTPDVSILQPDAGSDILSSAEEDSILETKRKQLYWKLGKIKERRNARCSNLLCKASMAIGKLFVTVDGLYHQTKPEICCRTHILLLCFVFMFEECPPYHDYSSNERCDV